MKSRKPILVVLVLLLVLSVGINIYQGTGYNNLSTSYYQLQSYYYQLQAQYDNLSTSYNQTQSQLVLLQTRTASLQKEVTSLAEEKRQLQEKLKGTLPYAKASGKSIQLLNNFNGTHNPSWEELKAFLRVDNTDDYHYSYSSFICGDFAELLHNNAEQAGIRAALVVVHFTVGKPHALNAFYTSDRRLVYVDCTGEGLRGFTFEDWKYERAYPIDWDKIAYIIEGKEYGLISLDAAASPSYDFYIGYKAKVADYSNRVDSYNAEVDAYNLALRGRILLEDPEYTIFKQWYDRLEHERVKLERLEATLSGYSWSSLGIVSKIEVFW